jgi:hypothetical protein
MKFEDLKLEPGYPLQLQINTGTQPARYSCRLVGYLPGRSLLLSVPKVGGKYLRFRPGQKLVVRMMVDNGIGVFACVVEAQTTDPYPIIHVSYPESVSFKGIRGATRVAVNQPIVVFSGIEDLPGVTGTIADISISGARLEMDAPIGEVGDKIRIQSSVKILEIRRNMELQAVIRSRVERSTQEIDDNLPAVYGVEFVEQDEESLLLLYAYVFSHIARDER